MEFRDFKLAVARQFQRMQAHDLFRTGVSKDLLWETYLGSFPVGSNPLYKERTEHDCNCCKQFIRAVGDVVAIIDGRVESIWDVHLGGSYGVVASALSTLVRSGPIKDAFLHYEPVAGTDKNFQGTIDGVKTWEHFFVHIPPAYVCSGAYIGPRLNEARTTHDVLFRGLSEITLDSIEVVQDLIAQNTLYRGAEHSFAIGEFKKLMDQFQATHPESRDKLVWSMIKKTPPAVSRLRNSVIGTLLTDLSEGVDLEVAVKAFESKVAPTNYKRPTALVTKAMVDKARATIEELGLTSALERRYATLSDITINNLLFANRDTKKSLNVFDDISGGISEKSPSLDKVDEVTIQQFIENILPRATSVQLMMENRHSGNLVSLIAPSDPTALPMFKWNNGFSWSYNGELADSMKEKVKSAGGNVTGDLCCRLAWYNADDLDFHMIEPTGYEIYFGNRRANSSCGGQLDIDMNGCDGKHSREPVENIVYSSQMTMREGTYQLWVHNYTKRESVDVGFEAEIDFRGQLYSFNYPQAVRSDQKILVAKFSYTRSGGVVILESLPQVPVVKTVWGVTTNTFRDVRAVMMSPNYWDGQGIGNKHYFFLLEGCQNGQEARGFFNEFLKSELDPHRKVIEMVGSKMRAGGDSQLSGLGFSSTQPNSVLCKVQGAFTRTIKILF